MQTHEIDALYVHCNVQLDDEGHTLYGNMDVVVVDPVLIRDWRWAVIGMPIKENETFSSTALLNGAGTKLTYCINVNGEIIEFFEGQRMGITYTRDFIHDQYPYVGYKKKDSSAYNELEYVNRQIVDAVNERYMEIYKNPINYPYILD